jgi:glycosyltransferase involved in cell wall biosynthesis
MEIPQPQLAQDKLELCYLGAINNIISIPDICGLINQLTAKKPVTLHIIGKGERQEEFVEEAQKAGAEVIFYGAVYDEAKKLEIMNRCHLGLNIMKSSVCVGLTMKSVDYFRFGLPIINNIPADTRELVIQRNVGYQMDADCAEKILSSTIADWIKMRTSVEAVFSDTFHKDKVLAQYGRILDKVV